jgi:hypothetical protein
MWCLRRQDFRSWMPEVSTRSKCSSETLCGVVSAVSRTSDPPLAQATFGQQSQVRADHTTFCQKPPIRADHTTLHSQGAAILFGPVQL